MSSPAVQLMLCSAGWGLGFGASGLSGLLFPLSLFLPRWKDSENPPLTTNCFVVKVSKKACLVVLKIASVAISKADDTEVFCMKQGVKSNQYGNTMKSLLLSILINP